jgi:hypothetical protein
LLAQHLYLPYIFKILDCEKKFNYDYKHMTGFATEMSTHGAEMTDAGGRKEKGIRLVGAARELLKQKEKEIRVDTPGGNALRDVAEIRSGRSKDLPLIARGADGMPTSRINLTIGNPILVPKDAEQTFLPEGAVAADRLCIAGIEDVKDEERVYLCSAAAVDASGNIRLDDNDKPVLVTDDDGNPVLTEVPFDTLADLQAVAEAPVLRLLFSGDPNAQGLFDAFTELRQDPDGFIPTDKHDQLMARIDQATTTTNSTEPVAAPTQKSEPPRNGYRYDSQSGLPIYGSDADADDYEPFPRSHRDKETIRIWRERVKRVKEGGAPLSPEELQELDDMAPASLRAREFDNNKQAAEAVKNSDLSGKEKRKAIREILKGTGKWTGISIMAMVLAIPLSMIPLASGAMELTGIGQR